MESENNTNHLSEEEMLKKVGENARKALDIINKHKKEKKDKEEEEER